jgi:hypothetical protein
MNTNYHQQIILMVESLFGSDYFNRQLNNNEQRIVKLKPTSELYFIKDCHSDIVSFLKGINEIFPFNYRYFLQLSSIRILHKLLNGSSSYSNLYMIQRINNDFYIYLGSLNSKIYIPENGEIIFTIELRNFNREQIMDDSLLHKTYMEVIKNYLKNPKIKEIKFSDVLVCYNTIFEDYFEIFRKNDFVQNISSNSISFIAHDSTVELSFSKFKSFLLSVLGYHKAHEILQLISVIQFYHYISGDSCFSYFVKRNEKVSRFLVDSTLYTIKFSNNKYETISINLSESGFNYSCNNKGVFVSIDNISVVYDTFRTKIFDTIVNTLNLENINMEDITTNQVLLCHMINY